MVAIPGLDLMHNFSQKHLPGNPTVVVINNPGGGSIKGANIYAKRATSDGLMLFGTSGSTQLPFLLGDPRVKYDYANFKPIMVYPNGGVVYVSPKLKVNSAQDIAKLQAEDLKYASQGPTSLDIVPILGFRLLKMQVKPIFGFRGRGVGRLAFERGEVKIDYQTSSSYLKNVVPLIQNKEAIPLWSWGVLDADGNLIRDPSFPKLPHFGEVYKKISGSDTSSLAYKAWFSAMSAGFGGMKLLIVPKETPQYIVDIYTKTIEAMKKDQDYIAKKPKAIGFYKQLTGAQAQKVYTLATTIDKDSKQWLRDFLIREYKLKI